jgi:hypothetical protein
MKTMVVIFISITMTIVICIYLMSMITFSYPSHMIYTTMETIVDISISIMMTL